MCQAPAGPGDGYGAAPETLPHAAFQTGHPNLAGEMTRYDRISRQFLPVQRTEFRLRLRIARGDAHLDRLGIRTILPDRGISSTEWKCLGLLEQHGPLPAGRLAELSSFTTGATPGAPSQRPAQRDRVAPAPRRRVAAGGAHFRVAGPGHEGAGQPLQQERVGRHRGLPGTDHEVAS